MIIELDEKTLDKVMDLTRVYYNNNIIDAVKDIILNKSNINLNLTKSETHKLKIKSNNEKGRLKKFESNYETIKDKLISIEEEQLNKPNSQVYTNIKDLLKFQYDSWNEDYLILLNDLNAESGKNSYIKFYDFMIKFKIMKELGDCIDDFADEYVLRLKNNIRYNDVINNLRFDDINTDHKTFIKHLDKTKIINKNKVNCLMNINLDSLSEVCDQYKNGELSLSNFLDTQQVSNLTYHLDTSNHYNKLIDMVIDSTDLIIDSDKELIKEKRHIASPVNNFEQLFKRTTGRNFELFSNESYGQFNNLVEKSKNVNDNIIDEIGYLDTPVDRGVISNIFYHFGANPFRI